MTDSSPPNAQTVLILNQPRLPGAKDPVVGAHLGVPLRLHDLTPFGCEVVVDPYLNQEAGDTVSINLNGELSLDSRQTQGLDDAVTLYIPKGKLLPGIINRLTFTVTRGSTNIATSEPPLEILYNKIRPGNQDLTPGDGEHSELVLLLPDEIKDGVGPGFTQATMSVDYPYCRAYDLIRLNCNGHDVEYTVTDTQAPPPPNHGVPTPTRVSFVITSADLIDDPEFKFSFTVNDQLGNSPDTDSPWSAVHTVEVDMAGVRLPQPIPREVLSEAADDPSLIDLGKLGTLPLSIIILTSDPRFLPGSIINMTYVAKVTGQPDIVVPRTGTVEVDELGQKKACVLQVPYENVVPNSTVETSYKLFNNQTQVGYSRIARSTVVGEAIPDEKPVITMLQDSAGVEVPDGGRTFHTRVMLTGTASKGQEVEVFDDVEFKAKAGADSQTGVWSVEITDLSIDLHRLTAKALYGTHPVSDARTFTVIAQLVIDTSPVLLDGFFLYIGAERNATPMPAGTTVIRNPVTGNPGYAYHSSNSGVARVDGNGRVEGWSNGYATITITDAYGQTASYGVTRSNAWTMATIPSITGGAAPGWANSQGAGNSFASPPRPDGGTMQAIRTYYHVPRGLDFRHWTGAFENGVPEWPLFANPYTGEIGTSTVQAYLGAYCRVPYNSGRSMANFTEQ
ncbi:Ig-like domain-containing protein [Pseudomonas sp. R1-7]|uniref:Ig-like domain-containing protein n=1 Tax=Pseudomonas sp. R1-7 TaxID=2817398 RepID=UPI003DA7E3D4